jgi:hypothetical protein
LANKVVSLPAVGRVPQVERKVRVQMERVAREHARRAAQQKTEIKAKQKAQQERAEKEHMRILQEAERCAAAWRGCLAAAASAWRRPPPCATSLDPA